MLWKGHSNKTNLKDVSGCDYFLGFGHRRLSILDLSECGHQPMVDEGLGLAVVFNGAIYNYIEIKKELYDNGYVFNTACDTEVLLKAYDFWGDECVKHFNGMWAFVIYDRNDSRLFCYRDRLRVKPFHYYLNKNKFIFGSELKQLCQDQSINRYINEEYLSSMIVFGVSDYDKSTLIRDFFVLEPGHNLVVSLKDGMSLNHKIYCYWDLDIKEKYRKLDINKLYEIMIDSVKLRTRSDVHFGVMLSGGLDSSCLVYNVSMVLGDKLQKKVNTYTSYYRNDDDNNENYFSELVDKQCGTKGNIIDVDPEDPFCEF